MAGMGVETVGRGPSVGSPSGVGDAATDGLGVPPATREGVEVGDSPSWIAGGRVEVASGVGVSWKIAGSVGEGRPSPQ